jgi:hypothetical protein
MFKSLDFNEVNISKYNAINSNPNPPVFREMMRPYKCCPHVNKMPTIAYNWKNSVIKRKV